MATILTESQAKQILQEQEQRDRLENETKQAVAQARATLISAEAQRKREQQVKEYRAILKRLNLLTPSRRTLTRVYSPRQVNSWKPVAPGLTTPSRKVELSKQVDKSAFALNLHPPKGLQIDQHIFSKPFYGLIGKLNCRTLFTKIHYRTREGMHLTLQPGFLNELDDLSWNPC